MGLRVEDHVMKYHWGHIFYKCLYLQMYYGVLFYISYAVFKTLVFQNLKEKHCLEKPGTYGSTILRQILKNLNRWHGVDSPF